MPLRLVGSFVGWLEMDRGVLRSKFVCRRLSKRNRYGATVQSSFSYRARRGLEPQSAENNAIGDISHKQGRGLF